MMNPSKFRKMPVTIEAVQFLPSVADEVAEWCNGRVNEAAPNALPTMIIPTLEGDMRAQSGDWIIKGIKGEFYPCAEEIFYATYESTDS